jgi:hypothetical protein
MKSPVPFLAALLGSALLSSCASLTIDRAQFAWPVESLLTVSGTNWVDDGKRSLAFSVSQIAQEEFGDSAALKGKQIRVIRNLEGYYFLTGKQFRNVYVFAAGKASLEFERKIEVSQSGLKDPAMNQRPPYIELLDGDSVPRRLTADGITQEEKR